jgi:hypothetical protein
MGNYINMNIRGEIDRDFTAYVTTVDPMYMHEYGHTIDSRNFGIAYLFAIGIPSAISASRSEQAEGEYDGVYTHDLYWTEIRANKLAKNYFEKYYGVDWNMLFHIWGWKNQNTTIETFYPTTKR